jgi:hypothetical protein
MKNQLERAVFAATYAAAFDRIMSGETKEWSHVAAQKAARMARLAVKELTSGECRKTTRETLGFAHEDGSAVE